MAAGMGRCRATGVIVTSLCVEQPRLDSGQRPRQRLYPVRVRAVAADRRP